MLWEKRQQHQFNKDSESRHGSRLTVTRINWWNPARALQGFCNLDSDYRSQSWQWWFCLGSNMLSLITQKSLINKSLAMPGIWQWFLLRPFEFQSLGTAVGSPGGGQSKQKQAHPAVTESIDNDTPHHPNKVFTDTCWACFQKPPCHRDLVRIISKLPPPFQSRLRDGIATYWRHLAFFQGNFFLSRPFCLLKIWCHDVTFDTFHCKLIGWVITVTWPWSYKHLWENQSTASTEKRERKFDTWPRRVNFGLWAATTQSRPSSGMVNP